MWEVISQRTFFEVLFRQLFLNRFPQQVQLVPISFQNNAVDELGGFVYRAPKISGTASADAPSVI